MNDNQSRHFSTAPGETVGDARSVRRSRRRVVGATLFAVSPVLSLGVTSGLPEAGATQTGALRPAATVGTITNYTGTGINKPVGIITGRGRALWVTNYGGRNV